MTIRAKEAFIQTPAGVEAVKAATVNIEGDRIAAIGADGGDAVDCSAYRLLPGLVDIHVHGGGGVDVMDGTAAAIRKLAAFKLREGVTSFCPTTVTSAPEKTSAAITAVRTALAEDNTVPGAKIIGSFLEGPYISPQYKGAHPEAFIRGVSVDELRELITLGGGSIRSVALAPELPHAAEAVEYLRAAGVNVRLGHSGATLEQADAAIAKGAGIMIHTYNAMSAFSHREPGMVGAVLSNAGVYAEVICDLVHVHPAAVRVLVNAKGVDKVVLITDCMRAGGLPDGNYTLGELPVVVKDSIARLAGGSLAGSTLNLMTAVRNMHEAVGVPLAAAVGMASANPAAALGLSDIGGIAPGKKADLVAIDDDYRVMLVMVDGKIVYDAR